jgi:hypothetical protein
MPFDALLFSFIYLDAICSRTILSKIANLVSASRIKSQIHGFNAKKCRPSPPL